MNHSLKGALLSGLVFPGLGQWLLGWRRRGALLMLATALVVAAMLVQAVRLALAVLARIESEGAAVDPDTIRAIAFDAAGGSGSGVFQGLTLLLLACWLGAIIDAFRLGRRRDRGEPPPHAKRA